MAFCGGLGTRSARSHRRHFVVSINVLLAAIEISGRANTDQPSPLMGAIGSG